MKKNTFISLFTFGLLMVLAACQSDTEDDSTFSHIPDGCVEVRVEVPRIYTVTPPSSRAIATLPDSTLYPLDEGATLWLLIEGNTQDNPNIAYRSLKSYVVKGKGDYQSLYPCVVDNEGKVVTEEVAPLYLPYGTYKFTGITPARPFRRQNGTIIEDPINNTPEVFYQQLLNGQYLIANDARYTNTTPAQQRFITGTEKVKILKMNPMINQTARLKFTISLDKNDPYLHSCDISPIGVEISGIQTSSQLWQPTRIEQRWGRDFPKDTLIAYPGKKEERLVIYDNDPGVSKYIDGTDERLVIEAHVLPTDCTSNSVIILFNLDVNGMPTQYQMMLNRKVLRAGYSYHYLGKLSLVDGITAIAWQHVAWDTDVEIDVTNL